MVVRLDARSVRALIVRLKVVEWKERPCQRYRGGGPECEENEARNAHKASIVSNEMAFCDRSGKRDGALNFQRMTGSGRRFSSFSGDDGHFIGLLAFPPAERLTDLGSLPEFDKVYLRSDKVVA